MKKKKKCLYNDKIESVSLADCIVKYCVKMQKYNAV